MATTKPRSPAAPRVQRTPTTNLAEGLHLVRWSDTPDTLRAVFGAKAKARPSPGGDPVVFELGDVPLPGSKLTLQCVQCMATAVGVTSITLSREFQLDDSGDLEDWRTQVEPPVARWFEALGVTLASGHSLATLDTDASEGEGVDCVAPGGVRMGVSLVWDPPTFTVSLLAPDYEAREARARRGPIDAMLAEARAADTPRARGDALRTFERKRSTNGPSSIDDDGVRAWLLDALATAPNAEFAQRAAMLLVSITPLDRLGPRLAELPLEGRGATAFLSGLYGHYFAWPTLDPAVGDWLLRASSSPDVAVREAVAPLLARVGEAGVAELHKLLRDRMKRVRVSAMSGLRYAPGRVAVDTAREALRTPALDVDETAVGVLAAWSLVDHEARDDARKALREALTHDALDVKCNAALALLAIDAKDAEAFSIVDAVVSDPKGLVETRTHWLQQLVSRVPVTPTMRGLLQRLSRDKKAVVRAQAAAHATALRKRR